ncbi:MAG: PEP-CTERM sorting domain-containing protein [Planctomycetota bacterium]|nr:PEP-CTERM sorting domain-containing protein [Planctomycetota bacterium]
MNRHFITTLTVALACSCSLSATADVLFTETFDGPSLPTTLTYTSDDTNTWLIDASNRLFGDYDPAQAGTSAATAITIQGFLDPVLPITYSLDVGAPEGIDIGNYNVGLAFGDYQVKFHPGYPDGAFRMGGGYETSNQDMGFTPKLGVMHHMAVTTRWLGSDLSVEVTVEGLGTDDLMHTFTYSFIDTINAISDLGSGTFGARRSGDAPNDVSDVMFDNFQAEVVPEPSSVALLLFGAVSLAFAIRRRRRNA